LVWPKPILAPASLKTQRRQDRKNPSPRLVEGFNDTVLDPERAIHRQVWASEWRQANPLTQAALATKVEASQRGQAEKC
jgi:hypothetical protein